MRSFIFSILAILSIYNAHANEPDRYCGRWEYIPEDIILYPGLSNKKKDPLFKEIDIVSIGTIEKQYYVWMSPNRGFTFRRLNDTTLYSFFNGDTTLLHYHVKSNTLQFSPTTNSFVGATHSYFPHFKRTGDRGQPVQLPARTETFFNYDVHRYENLLQIQSIEEDFFPFPFAISESFIARRKIRQMEINVNWMKSNIPEDHRYLFDFDPKGNVISMSKIIGDSSVGERWSFIRRKDGSLQTATQIITYDDGRQRKNEYQYDVDSWPVDNAGQKIIDDIYEWEMADGYHPRSVRRKESLAWLSYEFQKNELRGVDINGTNRKLMAFSFEYSADGVLTRISVQWMK